MDLAVHLNCACVLDKSHTFQVILHPAGQQCPEAFSNQSAAKASLNFFFFPIVKLFGNIGINLICIQKTALF